MMKSASILLLFIVISCSYKARQYLKGVHNDEYYSLNEVKTDVDLSGRFFEYRKQCGDTIFVKSTYEFISPNDFIVTIPPYDEWNCELLILNSIPGAVIRTVKGKYYVKNKILYMETLMVGGFELKNIIMECILDSTTIVNDICYSLKKGKKKFVTEHNIVLFEIPGGNTKGVLE